MSKDIFFFFFDLLKGHIGIHNYKSRFSQTPILAVFTHPPPQPCSGPSKVRGKGPERCICDQSKIIFINLWIHIFDEFLA